jgi:hypothetical protein
MIRVDRDYTFTVSGTAESVHNEHPSIWLRFIGAIKTNVLKCSGAPLSFQIEEIVILIARK